MKDEKENLTERNDNKIVHIPLADTEMLREDKYEASLLDDDESDDNH